jgi:hypothetical protein
MKVGYMATITLKKARTSAPIAEQKLPELKGKFAVMRHSRNEKSLRFTVAHKNYADAYAEATRLQLMNPTERYLVVFIVGGLGE